MPSRPSTPPAGTATIPQSHYIHSTPHSRGSGSHYSYQSQNCQSHYRTYLIEDVKLQYPISFDEFLNDILRLSPGWISENTSQIHNIVHDQYFEKMVSKYREPVTHETSRYPSFIELANHAISRLNTKPDSRICLCRNDPVIVAGSHAARKPDVVGVRHKSLEVPERSSVDNLMNDGPNQVPFWWTELLFFFEFKVIRKDLTRQGAVVPLKLNPPVKPPPSPSPSTSRKSSLPYKELTAPTTATHSASRSLITSASESKRSPNTFSSRPHGSKKRRVDDTSSMLQCASYALEMMSHGGLRSHVISALVTDDTIQLLYYDHSIILVSEPVNFLEEPSHFVAMLHAMGNLELSQLGYADLITPPPLLENPRRTEDIFDGLKLTLNDGTGLLLGSTIYQQHGIIGRGTCVVRAQYIGGSGARCDDDSWVGSLVVKLSWPAISRISENDLIARARGAANHDEHRWVLKHLPKVLHAEDRHISSLSQALVDRMGDRYEQRVLRIIVQEELYPITEQTTAAGLAQSFREIFKCYRWLYEVPKILHRDISLNNLMLRKEGSNVYAVLNDLDLAVSVDVKSKSSKHRTGTTPFMAFDLLERDPTVHMYRHDLESLFYVLVWITSRFHGGVEIKDPPLQDWAESDDPHSVKIKFMLHAPDYHPTEGFESVKPWFSLMQGMFLDGFTARTRAKVSSPLSHFAHDTLGGWVTFDAFQTILDVDLL